MKKKLYHFEKFSTETQQAIEAFRREFWSPQVVDLFQNLLQEFVSDASDADEPTPAKVITLNYIRNNYIHGWLLAKGARADELEKAGIFLAQKELFCPKIVL